jgi:hypothetical protein
MLQNSRFPSAPIAQRIERQPSKLEVLGSNPSGGIRERKALLLLGNYKCMRRTAGEYPPQGRNRLIAIGYGPVPFP